MNRPIKKSIWLAKKIFFYDDVSNFKVFEKSGKFDGQRELKRTIQMLANFTGCKHKLFPDSC